MPTPPAGPAFTIASKPAAKPSGEDGPAPGDYEPAPADAGPAFTIGSRWRDAGDKEALPGPGDYHAEGPADGPAFTIAGKRAAPAHSEDAPGPGAMCDYIRSYVLCDGKYVMQVVHIFTQ